MKTNTTKTARLDSALAAAGIRKFETRSCYPEHDAPQNLQGRTHYVDAETLRYFKARILRAHKAADGILYWLVESVQSRPENGGATRRAVVFDVFGNVVNDRADATGGEWFKTTDKACDAARAFVANFDAVKHTADELKARAKRDIDQAKRTLATLAGRPTA